MIREFKEETGVDTFERMGDNTNGWLHFATMTFQEDVMGGVAVVYCFKMFSNCIYQCKTIESEQILRLAVDTALTKKPIIDNLPILIPMALHQGITFCDLNY